MIAHVFGEVSEKLINSAIIDVGGVGYEVFLASSDLEAISLNDRVKVYTYHCVREQSEELFGFLSLAAKRLFELLITVQSVGPKCAMNILSLGSSEDIRNAIANTDTGYISSASGVGKKTAERIVLELRDKVGAPSVYGRSDKTSSNIEAIIRPSSDEALDALIALGFQLSEATNALRDIPADLPVEERIRLALKS